ncbi:MAG TPA: hypothetical protein VGL22_07195 [Terracidiphilus sp.]|jgi:hypothetical protein
MKRLICLALLLCASVPGWSAAKKLTIASLQNMLQSLHRENKSDADVALALKQIQLSEQLTRPTMNTLSEYVPGAQSTEQMYVLEARSAMMPLPASEQPTTAALDDAAQKALLAKAATYASTTYQQLPTLTATRTTLRFQDNVEALAQSSGQAGSAKDMSTASLGAVNPFNFVRYIESTDTSIGMEHGVERLPVDKTRWGPNKRIQMMEPYPGLAQVFQEATDAGAIKWSRWEQVNGKPAAVFSYQVPRKKAHLALAVCCFPELDQAGIANFSNANGISGNRGGNAAGNFQTNTDWKTYKQKDLPYHGEFFIDPETGMVLRLVTQMETKPADVVHQADIRTDYGQVSVGDKPLILPVRAFAVTEIVVNGESGAGGYAERCTLFASDYKNYQLAGK